MLVLLLIWLPIVIGFTLEQVRPAIHDGRLAAPPTYDGIVYFVDAQSRLDTWSTAGARQGISDVVSDPPDSPWSIGVAAAAFMVAGPRPDIQDGGDGPARVVLTTAIVRGRRALFTRRA